MKLIKGISIILLALGAIFLPTQLSSEQQIITDTSLAVSQSSTIPTTHSVIPTVMEGSRNSSTQFIPSEVEGIRMLARMTQSGGTSEEISLSLPFNTTSNWMSAPANMPSIKWETGDTTTRFAVKNGAFIPTDKLDTWFIYGWFGSLEAITKPYNIKYPRWGDRHNGIDFAGRKGLDIVSASGGEVIFAGQNIGNTVIVKKDNYQITYGHLLNISVKKGDILTAGDLIGHLGKTGTTNPHLHFQVDKIEANQKIAINPTSLMNIDWDKLITPNASANRFYAGASDPKLQKNFIWI